MKPFLSFQRSDISRTSSNANNSKIASSLLHSAEYFTLDKKDGAFIEFRLPQTMDVFKIVIRTPDNQRITKYKVQRVFCQKWQNFADNEFTNTGYSAEWVQTTNFFADAVRVFPIETESANIQLKIDIEVEFKPCC